ncbi:hypothetical protein ACMFMG_000998 [Clarireedia jacksonii]
MSQPTPTPAPNLHIPPSSSTVRIQIINTTSRIADFPTSLMVQPSIASHPYLDCPSYSFLITHPSSQTSLLFDLGTRPDWKKLPPHVIDPLIANKCDISADILSQHQIPLSSISAIIWSHYHFDHIGNPSLFPPSTSLIVGPGFKSAKLPGYPTNQESPILESDYEGRELREIEFDQQLKIGRFNAFDYFGDGSFYLLDAPGHTVGHLCALARIASATADGEEGSGKGVGDKYIFMGGDACHHGGEFRPSPYLPLPEEITPNPAHPEHTTPCPGALFERLLRDGDRTRPFYEVARPDGGNGISYDAEEAQKTVGKVMEVDARDEVLVVIAHDADLLGLMDFFPKEVDARKIGEWGEKGRWAFLKDFVGAVEGDKE